MATISNADITQASSLTTSTDGKYTVTGDGIFDDLMEAVNTHLSAQFNLGRLTGADYATVYLGALQSSLQGSVQFILGKQQADKQADLLTKQIVTEDKKALDVVSTITVRNTQSSKDGTVKDKQALDIVNQTSNRSAAQTTAENTAVKQRLMLVSQTATEAKKAIDVASTTTVRNAQSTKDLLVKQEQVDMSVAQQATEAKKALDIVSTTAVRNTQSTKDALLKTAQTTVATNSAATELKKSLDIVASTEVKGKQALDISNQSLIRTQANDTETILKRQQIISEAFKNGMEVNEYIWEIEYNQNANETYTFTTNENLSDNDVEALMTEDPHVATYTVKTVLLNQVNNIQHSGKSTAETVIAKTNKEIEILEQKRITEYAQTQVTTNAAPAAGSIVGRQGTLYEKQALGFEWDAKNSFNKNIADILKIQINTLGTFNNQKFVTIEDLLEPFSTDAAFVPNTTTGQP